MLDLQLLTISTRLRVHRDALEGPTRRRLLDLACSRLRTLVLPREGDRERHAVLARLRSVWDLLAVEGAECDGPRAELVRLFVDVMSEYERGCIEDSPRCGAEWAHDLGLIDYDGDEERDTSSYSAFGDEVVAEIRRRDP